VLNVHWIAGFVSHAEVVHYAQYVGPAVWTLHDLNPFTGGCHFPGACNNYREGCGCCPVLSSSRPRDLAYRGWEAKRRSLARVDTDKLHLVAPSRWLAEAARSSALFRRYAVTVIPYGIDLQTYRPLPRDAMRMVLGIRPDARVILVVAAKLSDSRKAGPAFFSALAATVAGWRDTVVVTAGKHPPALADSMPHRALGPIENEAFLAALYSCADIHLMPTMDDNLPNAALETIACGAPIVGYATGGMPDIVGDDEAGVLTPKGDLAALLAAARTLLGDAARLGRLRLAARERAERLFAKELQVARYRALYETAIQPGKEV
jgi:glycosyltransferase involved in cell wall biosynthesis